MEILSEQITDDGDYLMDISYSEEEYEAFKLFTKNNGKNVDEMSEQEIVQFAVVGMLKEQIERTEDEQTRTSKTDKD